MIEYENLAELNRPFYEEYVTKCRSVIENGWFILGNEVKRFETDFAAYCGSSYSVGVANGLDALTMALKAFKFPEKSEVIVPSNTYIATILSILNCKLKPVLVEPSLLTYNIDPSRLEHAISPQTVAVMVVHLYGKCCEMDHIKRICEQHNLRLIEDCAQAHGANIEGKMVGTFGDFGAFSFYPTKNLGALGDAGCLTTNSASLFREISMMRNYGSEKKYYNEIIGVNSRLDELQAAFLNVKLKALDSINNHKRHLASLYNERLKDDFVKPVIQPGFFDVFHIYNIRHPRRDAVKEYLLKSGIKTEIHYPVPPHKQKAMAGVFANSSYPISEEIHNTTLSLPISFCHKPEDIEFVIDTLNDF